MTPLARLRHFGLFVALGLGGTLVHYAVLVGLASGLGTGPVLASTVGFVSGGVVNYLLARMIAFRSRRAHREALPRFFTIAGVGLVLNAGLMAWMTRVDGFGPGLPYLPAQLLTTALLALWHYAGNAFWTFRERRERVA